MPIKIYNSASIIEERKEKAVKINSAMGFRGSKIANLKSTDYTRLAERFEVAENSEDIERLRHKIVNAAEAPAASDIEAFFGKFFLDVTRRVVEAGDLTGLIAREETNLNFPEVINLRDILKFRGTMATVSGEGDPVPLIEQNQGNIDTLSLGIKAVGWKDSLKNLLYNQFFTMEKVIQAAVDADTDERNAAIIGAIVAATFHSSQKQAAVTTSSLSLDEKTYETFLAAIKVLRGLLDPQTKRKIAIPSISILCNSIDTFQIENVIRGQLNANGGGARGSNRPALPLSQILEYDQGINNGFTIGKKTASYPGVTAGKCYIFVPGVAMVANKRALTMETGIGSVLELSTEERAWYRIQGTYLKDLFGSSNPGGAYGGASGYGAIVEVTLPT